MKIQVKPISVKMTVLAVSIASLCAGISAQGAAVTGDDYINVGSSNSLAPYSGGSPDIINSAIGNGNAVGISGFTVGNDNQDGGFNNKIFGTENSLGPFVTDSFIVGYYNTISSLSYSEDQDTTDIFLFGTYNTVEAQNFGAFIFGYNNSVDAGQTTSFVNGTFNHVTNDPSGNSLEGSATIGLSLINNQSYQLVIGKYNAAATTSSPGRLFTIGNGTGETSGLRSNAFVVYDNGNASLQGSLTTNNGQTVLTTSTGMLANPSTLSVSSGQFSVSGGNITFGNAADRTIGVSSYAGPGKSLTIQAGASSTGNGGALNLSSGQSTGGGGSGINFQTSAGAAPSTKMVLDKTGKLGIGTTAPKGVLDVAGQAVVRSGVASDITGIGNYLTYGYDSTHDYGYLSSRTDDYPFRKGLDFDASSFKFHNDQSGTISNVEFDMGGGGFFQVLQAIDGSSLSLLGDVNLTAGEFDTLTLSTVVGGLVNIKGGDGEVWNQSKGGDIKVTSGIGADSSAGDDLGATDAGDIYITSANGGVAEPGYTAGNGGNIYIQAGAGGVGDTNGSSGKILINANGTGSLAVGPGSEPHGDGQTVVGSYNDTNEDDNGTNHRLGAFIVGVGTDSSQQNGLRVVKKNNQVLVLVQPSGDLSMGGFVAGEKP